MIVHQHLHAELVRDLAVGVELRGAPLDRLQRHGRLIRAERFRFLERVAHAAAARVEIRAGRQRRGPTRIGRRAARASAGSRSRCTRSPSPGIPSSCRSRSAPVPRAGACVLGIVSFSRSSMRPKLFRRHVVVARGLDLGVADLGDLRERAFVVARQQIANGVQLEANARSPSERHRPPCGAASGCGRLATTRPRRPQSLPVETAGECSWSSELLLPSRWLQCGKPYRQTLRVIVRISPLVIGYHPSNDEGTSDQLSDEWRTKFGCPRAIPGEAPASGRGERRGWPELRRPPGRPR